MRDITDFSFLIYYMTVIVGYLKHLTEPKYRHRSRETLLFMQYDDFRVTQFFHSSESP